MRKLILALTFLLMSGCTVIEVPAPKQFDCSMSMDRTSWYCKSRVSNKCIRNEYVDMEYCSEIEETP